MLKIKKAKKFWIVNKFNLEEKALDERIWKHKNFSYQSKKYVLNSSKGKSLPLEYFDEENSFSFTDLQRKKIVWKSFKHSQWWFQKLQHIKIIVMCKNFNIFGSLEKC